jgi:hypothetical protein
MVVTKSGITRPEWWAVARGAGGAIAVVGAGDVSLVFVRPGGGTSLILAVAVLFDLVQLHSGKPVLIVGRHT